MEQPAYGKYNEPVRRILAGALMKGIVENCYTKYDFVYEVNGTEIVESLRKIRCII